jgi:anaerobic magnesium-protoporphyrin IX monomethyl ester cyclase
MSVRQETPRGGAALLINPSLILDAAYGKVARLMRPVPYINLAYLAATLERHGAEVRVHDDSVRHLSVDLLAELIKGVSPVFVGISCLTPHATRVAELSRHIRTLAPETPIVLGNIHASYFAEDLIEQGVANVVARGEADETVVELFSAFVAKRDLSAVRGISFGRNGTVHHTPERPLLEDLDTLPFPAWHLFPYKEYSFTPLSTIKRPLLPILGSRGCPYKCSFCVNRVFHRTYRMRHPERILEEIRYLAGHYHARQISFFDSNFPLKKDHCLAFCAAMRKSGLQKKVVWTAMTRPDLVDEDLLGAMKRAGCRRIYFGMESGDDRILRETGKGFTVRDIERAARLTRKVGLESCGYFMVGFPGDTKATCQKTLTLALRLPLDFANFNLVVPYPGTDIFERLRKEGALQHTRWERYATFNPDPAQLTYLPNGLPPDWLVDLQKQALFRFYFRPKMIFRHLFVVRTISIRDMLRGLRLYLGFSFSRGILFGLSKGR